MQKRQQFKLGCSHTVRSFDVNLMPQRLPTKKKNLSLFNILVFYFKPGLIGSFLHFFLCRYTNIFPRLHRKRMVESLVLSVLYYVDVIYGRAAVSTLNSMDAVYHSTLTSCDRDTAVIWGYYILGLLDIIPHSA